jgi:hypothetical protein
MIENNDYMIELKKSVLKAHTDSARTKAWKGERHDLYSHIQPIFGLHRKSGRFQDR